MRRRVDIEPDDVMQLLGEGRIGGQLEAPPAMRREAMGLPDVLDRRDRQAGGLGHGARRPVRRLVRRRRKRQAHDLLDPRRRDRRLAGRARLVPQEPLDAGVHESLLPAPDAGLRLARRGHDAVRAQAVGGEKHDPRAPDMLLRGVAIGDDGLQTPAIGGRDRDGDPPAHAADFACGEAKGNPSQESFVSASPLDSFAEIGTKPVSVLSYHNDFFHQVRQAYVLGACYPALVGACALGERILNHLILDLRQFYVRTPRYKHVSRKDSFNDWSTPIDTLEDWEVLLPAAVIEFRALMQLRHRSIHFNITTYDTVKGDALAAILHMRSIIEHQFGSFSAAPWFISGTIGHAFVKKEFENNAFVRTYFLQNARSSDRYSAWLLPRMAGRSTTVRATARAPGRTRNSPGNTMNEIRRKSFIQSANCADRTRKRYGAIPGAESGPIGSSGAGSGYPGAARMISATSSRSRVLRRGLR